MSVAAGKDQIDTLISNARFRCHRPIRVAEILYHARTESVDITDVESYRVDSGNWRDRVSVRLTGKGSSSSRSYQKDFSNLVSPDHLQALAAVNEDHDGVVENYIYRRLREDKWSGLIAAQEYVTETSVAAFSFEEYMSLTEQSGLEEDSMLEIAVYALFAAITRELDATARLTLDAPDEAILTTFDGFVETFLGLAPGDRSFETSVDIHRAGQGTYAADKGVDIGTNFGTMVQVKHVTLDDETASDIDEAAYVDRVVVVCREAERSVIENVSRQLGFERVAGIVTISELADWYASCFEAYPDRLGTKVLTDLRREFREEFQSGDWRVPNVDDFLAERGYGADQLTGQWRLPD